MQYLNTTNVVRASIASALTVVLLAVSYFVFEPVVSLGQFANPQDFIVTQTITDEISFLVNVNDVVMSPAIGGISGGYATGTTYYRVRSNSTNGYYVTLAFSDTVAMQGDDTVGFINNYTPATPGTPDYNRVLNSTSAEFSYTVSASTTSNVPQLFLDNGSNACNELGGTDTADKCWMNPSTTPQQILVGSGPTAISGATSTLKFVVSVPSNPSPALPEDTYTATATLTAVNN